MKILEKDENLSGIRLILGEDIKGRTYTYPIGHFSLTPLDERFHELTKDGLLLDSGPLLEKGYAANIADSGFSMEQGDLVIKGHFAPEAVGFAVIRLPLVNDMCLQICKKILYFDPLPGKEAELAEFLNNAAWSIF